MSEGYAELNRRMHERPEFGIEGQKYVKLIRTLIEANNTRDVLDYGCGKASLADALGMLIQNYDPCLPEFSRRPFPADLVTCTDVLEHVEPEFIDDVLDDIQMLAKKVVFFVIAVKPAIKTLPDGTNPHRIVQPWEWWMPKLSKRWRMSGFNDLGKRFIFVGNARKEVIQ